MRALRQIKDKFIAVLLAKYPALFDYWVKSGKFREFADTPWVDMTKDVSKCRLALITTGGVHLKSQTPFDMVDPDGDPGFREIPSDSSVEDLMITHNYYDHRDADQDINIVLPVERVRELKETKEIAEIASCHLSFMGHIINKKIDELIDKTAPEVVRLLKNDNVDIVLLTPA